MILENKQERVMATLSSMLPLRSGDTALRPLRESDVEDFHAYRSDPELARYQGWSVMSAEEARAFIAEMQDLISPFVAGGGQWIQLAIAQAASDELLGDVGLFLSEDLSYGEIGFTLCAAAHGEGHATRAAIAATELLFALTSAREVRGLTDARNSPSARVLERAGFEQVLVQQSVFKGEPCTELVYRRLR